VKTLTAELASLAGKMSELQPAGMKPNLQTQDDLAQMVADLQEIGSQLALRTAGEEDRAPKQPSSFRHLLSLVSGFLTAVFLPLLVVLSVILVVMAFTAGSSVNEAALALKRLEAIEKAIGDPAGQRAQLDRLETSLKSGELAKGFTAHLDNSTKAIRDLETKVAAGKLPQNWDEHIKTLEKLPKAVETLAVADGKIQGVKTELASFAKELKEFKATVAQVNNAIGQIEGQDVLIVALNSPKLRVKQYQKAYQDLFQSLPRDKDGPMRFGFAIAVTGQASLKVPLTTDEKIKWYISEPDDGATEAPEEIGGTVKNMFDLKRPRRRAVLVASSTCAPLKHNEIGWRDIPEVDVVLIQLKNEEEGNSKRKEWHEFCRNRRGFLQVIPPGDGNQQTALLTGVLRLVCQRRPSS
jgi:hypothetical protein